MSISGNLIGSYSPIGNTFVIVDENGNEVTGVCVDNPVVFTATDNDVREGLVYASDSGVSTGTKNIPIYRTTQGDILIFPGEEFIISDLERYDMYNYTQLLCVISKFNTSFVDSVSTDKIAISNNVYAVNSADAMSNITKNTETKSIDLNVINNTEDIYVVHYFTYKEEV